MLQRAIAYKVPVDDIAMGLSIVSIASSLSLSLSLSESLGFPYSRMMMYPELHIGLTGMCEMCEKN